MLQISSTHSLLFLLTAKKNQKRLILSILSSERILLTVVFLSYCRATKQKLFYSSKCVQMLESLKLLCMFTKSDTMYFDNFEDLTFTIFSISSNSFPFFLFPLVIYTLTLKIWYPVLQWLEFSFWKVLNQL